MEWRDLTFSVGDKELLNGVTGILEPGRVTGVMGPSGSGKTTLLNILSGRQRTHGKSRTSGGSQKVVLKGEVSMGGRVVKPSHIRSSVAYVFQENSLPEMETPRELLSFSAYLRLPREVTTAERQARVKAVLAQLHLESCADTVVGSVMKRGISGGEQKRTTVGVELIWGPRMIFLDEPLSGLDAWNAHSLVSSLKLLAASGVSVLMTVHQPSSEIFQEIDDLLVLHEGSVAYCGPTSRLTTHFEGLGFACPPKFNPADYLMFTILGQPVEAVGRIKASWNCSASQAQVLVRINTAEVAHDFPHSGESSCESSEVSTEDDGEPSPQRPTRNCLEALRALLGREFRRVGRDRRNILVQWLTSVFVALAYGWLFMNAGRQQLSEDKAPNCRNDDFDKDTCGAYTQVHITVLSIVACNTMMVSISVAITVLHLERHVFLRERAGGYYTTLPYFLVKTFMEVPFTLIGSMITLLSMYWLVGLHGNLIVLVLENTLMSMASSSMTYCFSALADNIEQAQAYSLVPQILQLIFSGLLVPNTLIPGSLAWLKWCTPLYYGVQLMLATEFSDVFAADHACRSANLYCPGVQQQLTVVKLTNLKEGSFLWPNLTMCVLLMVGLRGLAALILARRTRYVI